MVVATAFFMELFDSTVIVTALPTMAREFNSSVLSLSLGLTVYMLSTAVLLPASGWIADRYGTILTHSSGDLATKVFSNRFMNRFGFRSTLIGTADCFAVCIRVCASFSMGVSYWLIGVVLFIAGAARSLQMAAQNSLHEPTFPATK